MESFWAMMKRGFHGTYHRMFPKHLQRYVNEFAGRHNIRDKDTIEQMCRLACGLFGTAAEIPEPHRLKIALGPCSGPCYLGREFHPPRSRHQ